MARASVPDSIQVQGVKVSDPKSCGTCPSTRENSLTSLALTIAPSESALNAVAAALFFLGLGRPLFVVVAIFVFWMVQDSFGYNPSDSICATYLHALQFDRGKFQARHHDPGSVSDTPGARSRKTLDTTRSAAADLERTNEVISWIWLRQA